MHVIKRDGRREPVAFDKILGRLVALSKMDPVLLHADPAEVTKKVVSGVFDGVHTSQLDKLAAETAAYMASIHSDYGDLAARIAISDLQKNTSDSVLQVIDGLMWYKSPINHLPAPLISKEVYGIMSANMDVIQETIDYSRDFYYDYFGFKTLETSYLIRRGDDIIERPQHMLMRVAFGIHKEDIEAALQSYFWMSQLYFTHATPTLFNAGTVKPQMSSCFLLTMTDDSIEGIYDTLKRCAMISKSAGGIGVSVHKIRANQSYIRGHTGGFSNGLVPMLKVYNDTARYVDQGGGKRKGAFAIYLEPWHADIFDFLDLKKNTGKEENRARDLFYGLWIPDLFMRRIEENANWSLFCPNEAPGLADVYGSEFDELYVKYECMKLARREVKAQTLMYAIVESQIETGVPYMLFKDACNSKSNQQNLGTIRSSNLCTEVIQYTSPEEVAVCNLASICLPKFVDENSDGKRIFRFGTLMRVVGLVTRNLNKVIDNTHYPISEAKVSNERHRPIGIGVQGLADTFQMMAMPWESEEASRLNKHIFAAMYYAALEESCALSVEEGPYETFDGSPASQGILQFDMWGIEEPIMDVSEFRRPSIKTASYDLNWSELKAKIKEHGLRNSLLIASMPTASTGQIQGNSEGIDLYTSNIFTGAGDFTVVNNHLMADLETLGLWSPTLKNLLVAHRGSIQDISVIPDNLKSIYKTSWEVKQRCVIDMAADRGAYICQSQSMNLCMEDVTFNKLISAHFYAWRKGLKTGMYYLRTRPAAAPIQFTVDKPFVPLKDEERKGKERLVEEEEEEDSPALKPLLDYSGETSKCGIEQECLSCS